MTIIAHPIGDIDESILIPDIYKPENFKEGWYFMPHNFPLYQFISTDYDPNYEEVFEDGSDVFVTGFNIFPMPSGVAVSSKDRRYMVYPSGTSILGRVIDYWKLFADLDNPYLFVPYFDPKTYGRIVFLDLVTQLPRKKRFLKLIEKVLSGFMFPFKERVIIDKTTDLGLKEKIIALLNCDAMLVGKNRITITWGGDTVEAVEVLMKGIGDKTYGQPIATIPFDVHEYTVDIDDNSYNFTVRGINGTGYSLNEITIGMSGLTTIEANLDLGDYIKIYNVDVTLADKFEIELPM